MVYYSHMKQTTCPVGKIAELLSDTWTMLIIRDLLAKPMRFSELERSLEGISTRTLTLKLKRLIEKKIILKIEDKYQLTEQGKAMKGVIKAMQRCGKNQV